jgi:hypothetical protein
MTCTDFQQDKVEEARAIFDILAAPGQCYYKDVTRTSTYWINRARFEERVKNKDEALRVFEQAERIGCEVSWFYVHDVRVSGKLMLRNRSSLKELKRRKI